jgi:hypothetical protein
LRTLVVTALALVAGCKDLPDIGADRCGNGVVEPAEDCEPVGDGAGSCGAEETANACFFVCADGEGCPTGFQCGADDRCRRGSGEFVAGPTVNFVLDQIAIGDVDGDRFDDVVTASGTSLMVGFGSEELDLASSLDTQVASPASALDVADLNDDAIDDVLVAIPAGVQTLLGTGDRALDPFSYPISFLDPASGSVRGVAVDRAGAAQDVVIAWNDQIALAIEGGAIALPETIGPDPADANDLVPIQAARLSVPRGSEGDPDLADTTVQVALGYVNRVQIHLYEVHRTAPVLVDPDIALAVGGQLSPGSMILFGFFDDDHCLDLLAHSGAGIGELVLFRGTPAADACTGDLRDAIALTPLILDRRVLAAGDFDGDGVTDLVLDSGVHRVRTSPTWELDQLTSTALDPYEGAQVVDLNGDGALDVAAFREGAPDVDVLINAGGGVFNRFVIPTSQPVQRLAAGDFDGDLTQDLAIGQIDNVAGEDTLDYSVSVSFGDFLGPPGPAITMDHFDSLTAVIPARINGGDAVDDLLVTEQLPGDVIAATVLFGSGARAMIAPLVFPNDLTAPEAVVVGTHDGDDTVDLFGITRESGYLFLGDGDGGLTLAAQAPLPPLPVAVGGAVWAAANVDGDPLGELAAAERGDRTGPTVTVALLDADPAELSATTLASLEGFDGAHSIAFTRLDTDDDVDLLVALDTTSDSRPSLFAGWNEGGVDALVELSGSEGCIDAVTLQLDGDDEHELIAMCRIPDAPDDRKDRMEIRRFDAQEPNTVGPFGAPLFEVDGGALTRLLAGDINGDGLTDLIFATSGSGSKLRVFAQRDQHEIDTDE